MEEQPEKSAVAYKAISKRPYFLTIVCLFSFIFFGLISVMFLFALFYSGGITEIVNKYTPENLESHATMFVFLLAGFLLHGAAFAGALMIWRMKRKGFLIFATSVLIITAYQLFQSRISFTSTAVYILVLLCFGIFYKKMK